MAVLDDPTRSAIWADTMKIMSERRESDGGLNKFELYDVMAIVDDQMDTFLADLKTHITSKAQLGLPDSVWLRAIQSVLDARLSVILAGGK